MDFNGEIIKFLERISLALEYISKKKQINDIKISKEGCYLWSNENLSIGCFYFKNGYEMVDAISKMIEKKQTVNN